MPRTPWQDLRVYYHADQRDLILDAVCPLLDASRPKLRRAYFLRHWVRGPHVRVCAQADQPTLDRFIADAREALHTYVSRNPSELVIDASTRTRRHEALARDEQITEPLEPWFPDNTISLHPHDSRSGVLQNEPLEVLVEDFYSRSSELTHQMLQAVRRGQDLLALAAYLMVLSADRLCYPLRTGFVSYRSHAEIAIVKTGQPARVRAQLDRAYEDRRSQFQSLLQLSQGTGLQLWADAWLELMKEFRRRAEEGLCSGALDFAAQTVDPYDPKGAAEAQAYMRHSAFHRVHLADRAKRSARNRDLTFNVYRMLLNLQYLYLTRLGVTPWQRTFLGHLIANAVEEREQISAAALYERFRYTPSLPPKPRQ